MFIVCGKSGGLMVVWLSLEGSYYLSRSLVMFWQNLQRGTEAPRSGIQSSKSLRICKQSSIQGWDILIASLGIQSIKLESGAKAVNHQGTPSHTQQRNVFQEIRYNFPSGVSSVLFYSFILLIFFSFFCSAGRVTEPQASHMLGKCSTTERCCGVSLCCPGCSNHPSPPQGSRVARNTGTCHSSWSQLCTPMFKYIYQN
jgi:hypothetical protein